MSSEDHPMALLRSGAAQAETLTGCAMMRADLTSCPTLEWAAAASRSRVVVMPTTKRWHSVCCSTMGSS